MKIRSLRKLTYAEIVSRCLKEVDDSLSRKNQRVLSIEIPEPSRELELGTWYYHSTGFAFYNARIVKKDGGIEDTRLLINFGAYPFLFWKVYDVNVGISNQKVEYTTSGLRVSLKS